MALWLADTPLVLASRSSARLMVLTAVGIPVEAYPADLDERAVEISTRPEVNQNAAAAAALLAREKATAVERRYPARLTLGADQTLALGTERFSKPVDRDAAKAQLRALCGRTHELHSAIAFVQHGAVLFEHVAVARLTMRNFSESFLERYLDAL